MLKKMTKIDKRVCRMAYAVILLGLIITRLITLAAQESQRGAATRAQGHPTDAKKVALVIGNATYMGSISALKNPVNDAEDMAKILRGLGFSVVLATNVKMARMKQLLIDFGKQLDSDAIGLFYYSGHGLQVNGENYLLPIEANINSQSEIETRSISLTWGLNQIRQNRNGVNIVILDACRDNPFKQRLGRNAGRGMRSKKTRGKREKKESLPSDIKRGLAVADAPNGTFIAYATAPNESASDGNTRNGTYTAELLKELPKPGVLLEIMFRKVAEQVSSISGQEPWYASNVKGNVYLGGSPPTPLSAGALMPRNKYGLEFVWIPAGTFIMGNNLYKEEKPIHSVSISQPFEMGRFEVTQEQWRQVMGSNPSKFYDCPKCPVENVSWEMAQEFIKQLNLLQDGYKYRLPTEAEWEYAARAGTTSSFGIGDGENIGSEQANINGKFPTGNAPKGKFLNRTTPVESYEPNRWGLYDMHGNVWEWCEDWYAAYTEEPVTDPTGHGVGLERVTRGSSWFSGASPASSSGRGFVPPDKFHGGLGFRVARTPF